MKRSVIFQTRSRVGQESGQCALPGDGTVGRRGMFAAGRSGKMQTRRWRKRRGRRWEEEKEWEMEDNSEGKKAEMEIDMEKGIQEDVQKDMEKDMQKELQKEKTETGKPGKNQAENNTAAELVCIRCPIGCMITVSKGENGELEITGNTCGRGAEYARKEMTAPTRIVTSTVRIRGGKQAVVPVKTRGDVPKAKMFECMEAIKGVELKAPVHIGDVALADVAGTGVDMVVTKSVDAAFI